MIILKESTSNRIYPLTEATAYNALKELTNHDKAQANLALILAGKSVRIRQYSFKMLDTTSLDTAIVDQP